MRYRMPDDEVVEGRSYAEVVRNMSFMKMQDVHSLEAYREQTAVRVTELYGKYICPNTNKCFIESLESAGLMEKIDG